MSPLPAGGLASFCHWVKKRGRSTSARGWIRSMQRDDMPPPIAADLRPGVDGSAVRTAMVAWPMCCAPTWPRWDRQTDG